MYILRNYFKFMFTRHPLERILSAYHSKWQKRLDNKVEYEYFHRTYFKEVTNLVRKQNRKNETDITFEEFVKYLIIRSKMKRKMDEHFERFYVLCKLCAINYDFVGSFDTLSEDINYVLHKLFSEPKDQYFSKVSNPQSAKEKMMSYYNQLDPALLKQLEDAYKIDFDMFGYKSYNTTNTT